MYVYKQLTISLFPLPNKMPIS